MADALVSVVVKQLASFLLENLKEEVGLVAGARGEVKKLAATSVKVWLGELKDVAYEMEDLLEEWHTRILKSQMDGVDDNAGSSSSNKKVSSYFLSPCSCFNKLSLHHDIGRKMKELRERLDMIAIEKDKYCLNSVTIIEDPIVRLDTISAINRLEICGRDQDKKTIISKLLSESSQEQMGVPVISIVGMGGLGKTALAQLVFSDDEVSSHFEKKIWVCVSDPFDVKKLAEKIIEALGESVPTVIHWETLHQQLCRSIEGKKFLLVLDDVWTKDVEAWGQIKCALDLGAKGSRVVVTTRNEVVAVTVGSTYKHELAILDDHDCWLLFRRLAFYGRAEEDCRRLESIGKRISNKCKGVPLFAKTLGSLMPHKRTMKDWQDVLGSDVWELPKVSEDVLPPLLLSYNALPSHLRRCFTYCVVFIKDHSLHKDVLVKLWMAQAFVRSTQTRDMEIIGGEYFDELVSRSFFQDLEIDEDGNVSVKMHDLMHDFANFVANYECSIVKSADTTFDYGKTRHLSLRIKESDPIPSSLSNANNLRTFLVWVGHPRPVLDIKLSLHYLTCLRTLDLSCVAIETLPMEVENLIHLRYLDLSETNLVELPETVCNLRNLQTLKFNKCYNLSRLPKGLRKLVNLRHLELNYVYALECLPKGIEELRCLQTLTRFVMSEKGCQLRELSNLNSLCGSLGIGYIRGRGSKELSDSNLKSKEHLRCLVLQFVEEAYEGKIDDDASVIELFEPHPNLEKLTVLDYGGSKFPNWMEKFPTNQSSSIMLRRLEVHGCRNLEVLPRFTKMESLQYLLLQELDSMSPKGLFNGLEASSTTVAYPNLKELTIIGMKHWEEWVMETSSEDVVVMPLLRDLHIYDCPVLKSVPHQILSQSVRILFIINSPKLTISWLPPLLEELILDGDAGSYSKSLPFNDNTSLKFICIQNSPHSTLPQGLSQLKALQTLKVVDCNSLTCIPNELQHLTSLRELVISRCSILGPRCEKDVGKDWSIVSHIPSIYMNNQFQTIDSRYCE